jgi:hypothetical protein
MSCLIVGGKEPLFGSNCATIMQPAISRQTFGFGQQNAHLNVGLTELSVIQPYDHRLSRNGLFFWPESARRNYIHTHRSF